MMKEKRICPQCGAVRTDAALSGLCPKCLARFALIEETGATAAAPDPTVRLPPVSDFEVQQTGVVIGRYKLLEQIGEGGFGLVYMAEQVEPVQRKVALKVIKAGMDTKAVVARFEAERQALALMDHPNIASVLDAGTTQAGRPYFVMELVRGIPITEFCDQKKLATADRLALFKTVCHAVQHAHQKGIIHRDLKPNNILVTLHDGKPVPKVIDFGVAKALGHRLTDKTLFTGFTHMIGTPAYMSPEQAEMSGLDVDTRCDIYSLGVLLYELLTGVTPFDRETLAKAALDEVRRMIRETEPPKPSTRLLTLGRTLTTVAASRQTDAPKLIHLVRGDLDWIVMKCLEKDRTRRYETANGLARDIERHLLDEPVEACPPSAAYRFRKFARKNRPAIITASLVAAALVVGLSLATWQAVMARQQSRRADQEAKKAMAEATRAEAELTRANEVKRLIRQMLLQVAPEKALGADTTLLRNILDETAERLERNEITEPLVAAELHWIIGNVYRDLASFDLAEQHLLLAVPIYQKIKGETARETADVMNHLALIYRSSTRFDAAEQWGTKALRIAEKLDDDNFIAAGIMGDLATTYWLQNRFEEAEQMFLNSLEIIAKLVALGRDPTLPVNHLNNLGGLYLDMGRLLESRQRYQESLALMTNLPPDSPDVLGTEMNLAAVLGKLGEPEAAEKLNERVLAGFRKIMGETHPRTLAIKVNLAISYFLRAEVAQDPELLNQAEQLLEEVVEAGRAPETQPSDLNAVVNAKVTLGQIRLDAGDFDEAERLINEVIDQLQQQRMNASTILHYQLFLAQVYQRRGVANDDADALEKAKSICRQFRGADGDWSRTNPGQNNEARLEAMNILVSIYLHEGNNEEALSLATNLVSGIEGRYSPEDSKRFDNAQRLEALSRLGLIYTRLNDFSTAEECYLEVINRGRENSWVAPDLVLTAHANLGGLYLKWEQLDQARNQLEACLILLREKRPPVRFHTASAIRRLADGCANQGHRDQAVELLRELIAARIADAETTSNPITLNEIAQSVLTHDYEELRDPKRALPLAKRACEIARTNGNLKWGYLSTLALAQHHTGDHAAAVATFKEALQFLPDSVPPGSRTDLLELLSRCETEVGTIAE